MAEASWPFYGVETNETQFSKWARTLGYSGVNTGLTTTPGSGMAVIVDAGSALVRGVFYENDANKTLTVGVAPASGARKDAVILRLDQTANTITLVLKAGSANGSGGALPSLTQNETTWELVIGQVTVTAGVAAITSGMITAILPSIGLRVLHYPDAARRPTPAEPVALGVNYGTKALEIFTGGAWSSLQDVGLLSGTLSVNKGGTGQVTAKAALQTLGIYVQPTAPAHEKGRVWIPGTAPD